MTETAEAEMTTADALRSLGVRNDTLTDAEKATLDRDGYLALPGILSPDQIEACRTRLAELLADEIKDPGSKVYEEAGAERFFDLVNKGEVFEVCFSHPRVLAAIAHVLNSDLKLSSLNARAALPGYGLQALHADFGHAVEPGEYQVCNSIWLLNDFTPDNGATRVVPGSHRSRKMPKDVMADVRDLHSDEKLLLAPAGTVVVFNSHTWHGGTVNRTDTPRRAMHAYYTRRARPQQLNQREYLRPETAARLNAAARHILDV